MPAPGEDTLWQIAPGHELLLHTWGDEYVIFDKASGDTHLVSEPAGSLLECLQLGSASFEHLAEQVFGQTEILPKLESHQILKTMTEELTRLDLIAEFHI